MLSPCFLHREYEFSKVFNESNKSKFSLAKSSSPLSIFLDEDHFPLPHECQKSWNPCYLECEKQSHESLLQLEIKQVGHQSDEIPQEKMPVPVLASRIDNAISKLHKNQEANLPPSGQCPRKPCSGIIMATVEPLLKSKPLANLLSLIEERKKNGSKWFLVVHSKLICEMDDRRSSCEPDSTEFHELERCVSLIMKYKLKGFVRVVMKCDCRLKNGRGLKESIECLIAGKKPNDIPVLLCGDIDKSTQMSYFVENPDLRFADMTSIFPLLVSLS
ncbi:hypothetical protein RRG08_003055 [Elysia crispata]|uniref:Uncharacterized protein n=1 Tax=Elysia crispata TaxID=231223 RepID=A0AAE1B6R5_9GAST|nr:hypothetical protein RRG08_003055 [Elysia crispata]